jgi:hypothetical protein
MIQVTDQEGDIMGLGRRRKTDIDVGSVNFLVFMEVGQHIRQNPFYS